MATEAFEEIVETFAFLDDWEDRYRHVIELGRAMAPLDPAVKVPATRVEGCASQVWLLPRIEGQGPSARFDFRGDSDAHIVKGLVALLLLLYGGRTPAEILAIDARAELGRLDLEGHLSPSRANGLFAMVRRIRALAAAGNAAAAIAAALDLDVATVRAVLAETARFRRDGGTR